MMAAMTVKTPAGMVKIDITGKTYHLSACIEV